MSKETFRVSNSRFKKKKKISELLTRKYKNYKILELLTRIKSAN